MNQYTYTNCFELNNNNHNIENYLFDSSFTGIPIINENDCAEYAHYNNHPSFFFQNSNNSDNSKCYVFKYNNINSNTNDKNRKTIENNIINVNYDLKNNNNLPLYNLKEIYNEDGENIYQPLEETNCSSRSNPYKKTFKYYLLKSFLNNYDLDYNKINKRLIHIEIPILKEFYTYLNANTYERDGGDDLNQKKAANMYKKLFDNYRYINPFFKDLYSNSDMYNKMIEVYIENTLIYISQNAYGISLQDNNNCVYIYDNYHTDDTYIYDISNTDISYTINMDISHCKIKKTRPGYINQESPSSYFFIENFYTSINYIGIPLNLLLTYSKHISDEGIEEENYLLFTPNKYFEKDYQNFVLISFFNFLLYLLKNLLTDEAALTSEQKHNFKQQIITILQSQDFNIDILEQLRISQNEDTNNRLNRKYFGNVANMYSFNYFDIIFCLYKTKEKLDEIGGANLPGYSNESVSYYYQGMYESSPFEENNKYLLVEIFFNYLLVENTRTSLGTRTNSNSYEESNDSVISSGLNAVINNIKIYVNPQIKIFLSANTNYTHTVYNFKTYLNTVIFTDEQNSPQDDFDETIEMIKKIYLGEFRLLHIESVLKNRINVLDNENRKINKDIKNMKNYIDNIYLHSKLNNIENYIFNEKSKLNYLFNKNSSARQKNNDFNFLNNFILIENIVLCIMIFILILFFIKK